MDKYNIEIFKGAIRENVKEGCRVADRVCVDFIEDVEIFAFPNPTDTTRYFSYFLPSGKIVRVLPAADETIVITER